MQWPDARHRTANSLISKRRTACSTAATETPVSSTTLRSEKMPRHGRWFVHSFSDVAVVVLPVCLDRGVMQAAQQFGRVVAHVDAVQLFLVQKPAVHRRLHEGQ